MKKILAAMQEKIRVWSATTDKIVAVRNQYDYLLVVLIFLDWLGG